MTEQNEAVSVRFCIPSLGTEIILAQTWKFTLWNESRNKSLIKAIGKEFTWERYGGCSDLGEVTVPDGTRLKVDRIYIRQGKGFDKFDSVTFRIGKGGCPGNKKFEKTRFWVKLADVNKIVCYPIGSNPEVKETFAAFASLGMRFLDLD